MTTETQRDYLEDAMLLALKLKDGTASQEMQMPSRKGKERSSPT